MKPPGHLDSLRRGPDDGAPGKGRYVGPRTKLKHLFRSGWEWSQIFTKLKWEAYGEKRP